MPDILKKWYVIKTKNNSEKKVAERLNNAGFICYLPLFTSIRIWSDRKKKIKLPLIPTVVFVNTYEDKLNNVYNIPGVIGILKYLNKPAIVNDYEINNLKIFLDQNIAFETDNLSLIDKGQFVEVIQGPFKGIIGCATKQSRNYKIRIEVKSVNYGFLIEIPASFVRVISDEK